MKKHEMSCKSAKEAKGMKKKEKKSNKHSREDLMKAHEHMQKHKG